MNTHTAARWTNAALGTWLFVSAFMWTHNGVQSANACVVGLVCAGTALIGLRLRHARFFNALLAVWLFLTVWVFPLDAAATFWNHTLASALMLYVALKPKTQAAAGAREPLQTATTAR